MSLGVLQSWSWEVSGWLSRSFFVRLLYAFNALSKISWKLDDGAGET
jgi:hypothetical protein